MRAVVSSVVGYSSDPPALLMTFCGRRDLFERVASEPSDLKPDNILVEVSAEGQSQEGCIIDLGLVVASATPTPGSSTPTTSPGFAPGFSTGRRCRPRAEPCPESTRSWKSPAVARGLHLPADEAPPTYIYVCMCVYVRVYNKQKVKFLLVLRRRKNGRF